MILNARNAGQGSPLARGVPGEAETFFRPAGDPPLVGPARPKKYQAQGGQLETKSLEVILGESLAKWKLLSRQPETQHGPHGSLGNDLLHVYMCMCIHVYLHTCIHVYMYTRIHVYMYTCIHIHTHTCIHVIHVYVCIYI